MSSVVLEGVPKWTRPGPWYQGGQPQSPGYSASRSRQHGYIGQGLGRCGSSQRRLQLLPTELGSNYLRRAAADNFRIGVLRNQSKSTVSRRMYKATPKAMGTPITNSMTIRSGFGWCISHGKPGIEEAPVASK